MLPLIIGICAVVANVFIQAAAVILAVKYLFSAVSGGRVGESFIKDCIVLASVMLLLFCGHLVQIALWAELFFLCREFDDFYTSFYHSMVNFSSLGYGDIVMSARWRLLGSIEAVTGILMFGVSTAVFFTIIRRIFRKRIADMMSSEGSDDKKSENLKEFFSDRPRN
jgi:hypothetical protein